jgi:hypothetical protein
MARALATAARVSIVAAGLALVAWAVHADPRWAERHVLPSYCATGPGEWLVAHGFRWGAGAVGAAAALVLAPAVARRIGRASPRAAAVPVLGVAVAIAASLALAEAVMRRMHDRLVLGDGASSAGAGQPMTRVDPRLGWSYVPGRTTRAEAAGRVVSYAIDREGDRAASQDDAPDPSQPVILFAGESIAFGYGLEHDETFPFLVGRDLGVRTVNLAVVGYGNDQAHLRVLAALERFRRPLAVVTLFHPGQIRRNVDPWRPRLALDPSGALALVPPANGPRIAKLLQVLPWHGDAALRVTAATLSATARAARAHGAFPLFVVTSYGAACFHGDGAEPWIVDELFVRRGLPFVRVDLEPEDLLPGLRERHPGPRGARKIAAAVEGALAARLGRPLTSLPTSAHPLPSGVPRRH